MGFSSPFGTAGLAGKAVGWDCLAVLDSSSCWHHWQQVVMWMPFFFAFLIRSGRIGWVQDHTGRCVRWSMRLKDL